MHTILRIPHGASAYSSCAKNLAQPIGNPSAACHKKHGAGSPGNAALLQIQKWNPTFSIFFGMVADFDAEVLMENGKIKAWLPAVRAGSGADVFTIRLARALEQKGITCEITWFPLRYEVMPFWLRKMPAPTGTDIIFANSWNAFAFKRPGIALVATIHHAEFGTALSHLNPMQYLYRRALVRQYEIRSFRAADVITAVSQFSANSLDKSGYADKVEVIHNWIDINQFHPIDKKHEENRPFRLLFVGKHCFLKGADLLTTIMGELRNDFHLSLAGRISEEQKNRLPSNMSSQGWLNENELIRAYQECDALLFPSRSEGFGYTALEAMACGKPVITSDSTALPEVVADNVTGILCRTGESADFVAACRTLSLDTNRSRAMGAAARLKAVEEFSEEKIITKYLQLIERLV